jgi:protein-L-isoaspartate(D-aspartate) O-methyltransferase
MIEEHIRARGVEEEAILRIMGHLPRHIFLDEALAGKAYSDGPLPIGYGQTISQPYIVAAMTQALSLRPEDRVLEIGMGCGYQTAVLAGLAKEVYAVERIAPLLERGRDNLGRLGVKNVHSKLGDGMEGWPEMAPFQAILVAAYSSEVPRALRRQLSVFGRLVMPLGGDTGQSLALFSKGADGQVRRKDLGSCRFVPLVPGLYQSGQ